MSNAILTAENYFSNENNLKYMGTSQFKSFKKCEAAALAELDVEYRKKSTTALLVGSYVDAHFEGTLDIFKAKHPEIIKRDGSLKAEYVQADYIINRIERDETFMHYMSGEKQKIFTGEICGVPVKIKVDSLLPDIIVDLKCMKDFDSIWDSETQTRKTFIEAWGYDIQGAIYQEIIRQNIGEKLPFAIAAVSKEIEPDIGLFGINQPDLDFALDIVKDDIERYQMIKIGLIEPTRCGFCDYCKHTKKLTGVIDYKEALFC